MSTTHVDTPVQDAPAESFSSQEAPVRKPRPKSTQTISASSTAESQPAEPLADVIQSVTELVSPVWPLQDYVAVNPYMGLSDRSFLESARNLKTIGDIEALPSWSDLRASFQKNEFRKSHLATAASRATTEGLEAVPEVSELLAMLNAEQVVSGSDSEEIAEPANVAMHLDHVNGTTWMSEVRKTIGQHCGAWYDRGQASWKLNRQAGSLFGAWKETAGIDRRPEILGVRNFRNFVSELPDDPESCVQDCLAILGITGTARKQYLWNLALSVAGWSGWTRYQVFEAAKSGEQKTDFVELLAIRAAWDAALFQAFESRVDLARLTGGLTATTYPEPFLKDTLARYVTLTAREIAFESDLLASLQGHTSTSPKKERPVAQMVFCIDVRSERIRRHLETTCDSIQTFGFAGFFGVPMSLQTLGENHSQPQVPAPLSSAFQVTEAVRGVTSSETESISVRRGIIRAFRKVWKQFQTSATGCFGFVESTGLAYSLRLATRTLGFQKHHTESRFDGIRENDKHRLGPVLPELVTEQQQADAVELAHKILMGIGLTKDTGRLVVLCGHSSETENNPLKAALDCGACCGHSGEANARYAAAVLNHPAVREGLKAKGCEVAEDTWFLAAVHNTTRDVIDFYDADLVPESHMMDLQQTDFACRQAGQATLEERLPQLKTDHPDDAAFRTVDWSEVRPEWGLAGNAAFIIGRRELTASSDLQGRSFLHSYDASTDDGFQVLEQIMTAPLVVGHWINMQYYASTVDTKNLGSGSKTIHNVVGQFGIYSGNGGDLQTGLPLQCVHDGENFRHQAVRLLAVIQAPRDAVADIVGKHSLLEQLIRNRWLNVVVVDGDDFYRCTSDMQWKQESSVLN